MSEGGHIFREPLKASGVGAAESVDGLVRVADDEEALPQCAPGFCEAVLNVAHVLKLIHQQVGKGFYGLFAGVSFLPLEEDLQKRIEGIGHQIELLSDKRNTIIRVNRAAKTALEVFGDILRKDRLERRDLELIIRQIKVYEDRLEIQLQADVDSILRSGTLPEKTDGEAVAAMAEISEDTVNFKSGMGHISPVTIVQEAKQHPDKVFHANVISDGDPLEIYTSREGEVIFKKYSLLGGVEDFATELCETMSRSTGSVCAVTDRDTVIAVAGGSKRELMGKRITPELERIMEGRKIYQYTGDGQPLPVTEGSDALLTAVAAPILAEGDLLGLVLFITSDGAAVTGDTEYKLAQTIAAFLGRHMES